MYDEDTGGVTTILDPKGTEIGGEWQVNVADDDTRTMTHIDVAIEYAGGQLNPHDVYVWREGMDEWMPLAHCAELMIFCTRHAAAEAKAQPRDASAAEAHRPEDKVGTMQIQSGAVASFTETLTSEGLVGAPAGDSAPAVGVRSTPERTGARSETSSLFSVDKSDEDEPKRKAGEEANIAAAPGGEGGLDLGGGRVSTPPLVSPSLDAPLPVPAAPQQSAVARVEATAATPKGSHALVVVLAAAVTLLVLAGIGAVFVLTAGQDEPVSGTKAAKSARVEGSRGGEVAQLDGSAQNVAPSDGAPESDAEEGAVPALEGGDGNPIVSPLDGTTPAPASGGDDETDDDETDDEEAQEKEAEEKPKEEPEPEPVAEFNRGAARSALSSAAGAASGCGQSGGPTGRGSAQVTFSSSGRVSGVSVGPPFAGTAVGSCAAAAFRNASVPPFSGNSVSLGKSFFIK